MNSIVAAEGMNFALVGKSIDDQNFIDAAKGCQEAAALNADTCVLLGGHGDSNAHLQYNAIETALASRQYDAIAISVTKSEFIAQAISQARIPILTFDSPFSGVDKVLSRGYVGADNVTFGQELALMAQELKPNGGCICLMTVSHDPNLAERILAVRRTLSGQKSFLDGQRLQGEGGWYEPERCPWNSGDNVERTMTQLSNTFNGIGSDVFLSVGAWPMNDIDAFRDTVEIYNNELKTHKKIIIIGVGKILPSYKALLKDHLVHAYVSIDFFEMGRETYRNMKKAANGESIAKTTYTKNEIVRLNSSLENTTKEAVIPIDK